MGCWFLICFVLNYPNKHVLSCVYVNNSRAAAENTLGILYKGIEFYEEIKEFWN